MARKKKVDLGGRPLKYDDNLSVLKRFRVTAEQDRRLTAKGVDISKVCRAAIMQKLKGPLPKKRAA